MPLAASEKLADWLAGHLAESLNLEPSRIDRSERFSRYGLSSIGALRLIAQLSTHLGRPLSPTLVWEYPTIFALASHLTDGPKEAPSQPSPLASSALDEPVAIVGMACRFPGAKDLSSFFKLLIEGRSSVSSVPAGRWDATASMDLDEKTRAVRGGFLDDIRGFDPLFFGISPREAASLDPQQRLALELAWEALEDAGICPSSLAGSNTAVLIGAIWSDYTLLTDRTGPSALGRYTVTGTHHSLLANRVSYVLGLRGPSFAIDSACSSGLVVTHLAADSLRRGESGLALAGAVNLNLLPESALGVSRFGALSQDGRCYTFDARANGYVRGEGGGIVVLKLLSRAIADGDSIYCVLSGSAVNNDGASNGLTAPSPEAQREVLESAYRRADMSPCEVQYVEAHGTGTPLGDPIEAGALGAVLGKGRPKDKPLWVGSAKTNVGHLEGAAGAVGMIKVALAIKHRILPPSLNFESPNPHIDFEESKLRVVTEPSRWPDPNKPLSAGVSSFGLGGTNAHVVVREALSPPPEVLLLTGSTKEDLETRARAALASIDARKPREAPPALKDICRAQDHERGVHRAAIVACSHEDLARSLTALIDGEPHLGAHRGVVSEPTSGPGIVFVFPGQGAQWNGMARSLLASEPVIRAVLHRCDRAVRHLLGISLIDELLAPPEKSRLDRIDVSLPAIISMDIAVATWWRSMGIEPAAVCGHSTGEIAAAHIAGALDLDDTMRVICAYGRLIARHAEKGAMALVGLDFERAKAALSGYEDRVFRAISDSRESTVLAGDPQAIDALTADLSQKGVFCRRVAMNVAPHCPLVDELRDELFESLKGVTPRPSRIPLISEVTGAALPGERLDASHWVRNFGDPAFFSRAVDELLSRGHRVFLDVGPHPITAHAVLTNLRCFQAESRAGEAESGRVLASMRRDEDPRTTLLDTLAELDCMGHPVRWDRLYPTAGSGAGQPSPRCFLLPLSARSPESLSALAGEWRNMLAAEEECPSAHLNDLLYTASVRRDHHPFRLAAIGASRAELLTSLEAAEITTSGVVSAENLTSSKPKVVFVLPGQGSQWVGMGRELYEKEPVFRGAFASAAAAVERESGLSLEEELFADESRSRLGEVDVVQPLLFAYSIALFALWGSWGVIPDELIGHSMGEVAAAHLSGILSLSDAACVICRRSKLLKRTSGKGAMALIELSRSLTEQAIAPFSDSLGVAVESSPRATVVSGDPGALSALFAILEPRGVLCRRIKVDVASHSPQMDPLADDLFAALSEITPKSARIPMRSTVTGELLAGPEADARYWQRNLRDPVLFGTAITRALGNAPSFFVELSPHPVLLPSIAENLKNSSGGAVIASARREGGELLAMTGALGELYRHGLDIDFKRLFPDGGRVAPLPLYPWSRKPYWLEEAPSRRAPRKRSKSGERPYLSQPVVSALHPEDRCWEIELSPADELLAEHRVGGREVVPGAMFVEMALQAVSELQKSETLLLEDIRFERPCSPPDEGAVLQMAFSKDEDGASSVLFASRAHDSVVFERHARLTVHPSPAFPAAHRPSIDIESVLSRCSKVEGAEQFYESVRQRGIEYGESFRGADRIHLGEREALGRIVIRSETPHEDATGFVLPPAFIDACLHVALALFPYPESMLVPVRIARLFVRRSPPRSAWAHVRLSDADHEVDIAVYSDDGALLFEANGLQLSPVREGSLFKEAHSDSDAAHAVVWRPAPPPSDEPKLSGTWLVYPDHGQWTSALADRIRKAGAACVVLPAGADLDQALREHEDVRGAVCSGALDAAVLEDLTAPRIEEDLRRGALSALHLLQAIVRRGGRAPPRFVSITRCAQLVDPESDRVRPAASAVWGLVRTAAMEHPSLRGKRIDLPAEPASPDAEIDWTVRELAISGDESEVALRRGERYVSRLTRTSLEEVAAASHRAKARPIFGDRTIVITGGLGGLGLSVADFFARSGARSVVLIGRRPPSPDAARKIEAIEARGAHVSVKLGSVSEPSDVERIFREIKEQLPPLAGVVHAAGVLDDRPLALLSDASFWAPILPKALGAYHLAEATRDQGLDFFVLYSSVASVLGSSAQAAYSAANAFLDGFSWARGGAGLPATVVQWGLFADVGLASASEERKSRLFAQGYRPLSPEEGAQLLVRAIELGTRSIGLFRLSLERWIEAHPQAAGSPFFAEMNEVPARRAPKTTLVQSIVALEPSDRLPSLLSHVRAELGRVVRMSPSQIDPKTPWKSFGVDSLGSLELRNRLEASLGLTLSATLLYTYSTPHGLAEHLLDLLAPEVPTFGPSPEPMLETKGDLPESDELPQDDSAALEELIAFEEYLR